MTMGGCKIPRGQAPAPKAFSIAVQTANKLSDLDSEHDITLVGAFGDWHALTCRKCCAFWKGFYDLSKHHESASDCVSDRRKTNLERFHRLAPSLPPQAVDLCTKIWKVTKSDRKIISVPFCHFDLAKINKETGLHFVELQGGFRGKTKVTPKNGHSRMWTCSWCTCQWNTKKAVTLGANKVLCGKGKTRQFNLKLKARFWTRTSDDWRTRLMNAWKVTSKERTLLTLMAQPAATKQEKAWIRDVVNRD